MTGQRFGRLSVIEFAGISHGKATWRCICDCGNEKIADGCHLRRGRTTSCGCYARETASTRLKERPTYGHLRHGGTHTRLYRIWSNMKTRCLNPNNNHYKWYGGVGVTIYPEWLVFENFQEWAVRSGYREDLTLERENPYGNYEPTNFTWIPLKDQRKNQRRCKQWQQN